MSPSSSAAPGRDHDPGENRWCHLQRAYLREDTETPAFHAAVHRQPVARHAQTAISHQPSLMAKTRQKVIPLTSRLVARVHFSVSPVNLATMSFLVPL